MKTTMWMAKILQAGLLLGLTIFSGLILAEDQAELGNKIESIDYSTLPGGRVSIRVKTTLPLKNPPAGFTLNSPPRVALDFPQVGNGLAKNNVVADQGALKSITLAQGKERTRLVLNLSKNVGYSTSVSGNEVTILLQGNEVSANSVVETKFAETSLGAQSATLSNVDFTRGKNGEGRIIVDLSDASVGINIKQKGKTIVVDFINTDVPASLQRRLNVTNFNTPVIYVDTMKQGKNGRMVIEPKGNWEQSAYQADKKFIIDVRQVAEDPNKLVRGAKSGFSGEKLSLNFQNIEVRSVLQVIADFTGLNIITSDTVTGNLTLRLKDVPWDQAMDIIIESKGLHMTKTGNVISVAPAEEVNAKEKAELQALKDRETLEPLRTESFTLKYQKADDMRALLMGMGGFGGAAGGAGGAGMAGMAGGAGGAGGMMGILSQRGSVVNDPRTNTIFIMDTAKKLEEISALIQKIDIPVRQVMIESRLVIADEKFGRSLGARFGVQKQQVSGDNRLGISGTLGNAVTARNITTGTITETGTGRTGTGRLATTAIGGPDSVVTPGFSTDGAQDLMANLPVANAFGNFAFSLFRLPAGLLLNLELSALESDQRGKIVSSPRVSTANQKKATIAQGTRIPYLEIGAIGAAGIQFIDAVLSLEVTPQITPDDKIIMDLVVKKDAPGPPTAGVPSINTQSVKTQVLVSNGETAVLGGIYEQTDRNDVDKVPFFGDLPIIGNAFKRKVVQKDKTELLIFVTPKIMDDGLALN
ncbi:MAG: type IV pilus secretin PilQ [Methylotenera sp.]|nr:type IV pilus secretin PilQ [Methylotenera sp.]MDP2281661.1 type IV pilus secretin PilQ [Methylotenera sp.]MDP3060856.1 type IV pilus secretin PilQ [Methylotenera sp.]